MANEFTISTSLQCTKGSFNFLRNFSGNPNFNGVCLFHEVEAVPIASTPAASLNVSIGGTGTPGIAVFTNLSNVYNIKLFANADTSACIMLKPGESFVVRVATVTWKAQAVLVVGATPDSISNLEVAVFED